MLQENTLLPETFCKTVVEDLYEILGHINRYMHMKGTSSAIDIFYYIERSARAKSLCQQLTAESPSESIREELRELHTKVKSRWQHDFQLMVTPGGLHQYLKDDGRASIQEGKIVL